MTAPDDSPSSSLTTHESVQLHLEVWKTTVAVQQHFNDIEMKVRGLALTLVTALLGATAVAVRDQAHADLGPVSLPVATLLVATALVGWFFFFFMDYVWYHRLLLGAVRHGQDLEDRLRDDLPGVGLANAIRRESKWTPPRAMRVRFLVGDTMDSTAKMRFFYSGMALLLVAIMLATLAVPKPTVTGSQEQQQTQDQPPAPDTTAPPASDTTAPTTASPRSHPPTTGS